MWFDIGSLVAHEERRIDCRRDFKFYYHLVSTSRVGSEAAAAEEEERDRHRERLQLRSSHTEPVGLGGSISGHRNVL